MPVDLVTIMAFEDGQLSEQEIADMLKEMISSGELKILPNKYTKLAKQFVRQGLIALDEDETIE